ncbi:MAG: 16S rRNA (guanine(966)-N(2))-methyltransferase RsmD [Anaerolineae bacterium]|nr:16S rRNA (guanine(966)-N(2))-methyltransferase RsmD [Anaerolineae bacterium]
MSNIRVVSGKARGIRLKTVPGDTTRPIMDRVKENLFNILGQAYVLDAVWLDLFGGTGQVGIEALSRGAREVIFLDTARAAIQTIHANLAATRLADNAAVLRMDAFDYLQQTKKLFDVIFIAPPQYKRMWVDALLIVDRHADELLQSDGIVVVQIDPREDEFLELQRLHQFDKRTYGNTLLSFYELAAL